MRKFMLLAAIILVTTAAVSCAPVNETAQPIATDPPATDLEIFENDLLAALTKPRDYSNLTRFMSDSWEDLIFRGNGQQYAPADAVEQLRMYLLPPDNVFAWDRNADMTAMLGEDPMQFYRGNAKGFVYTTGWGQDGKDAAILVINQDAAGRYFWQGILYLYSPGGN